METGSDLGSPTSPDRKFGFVTKLSHLSKTYAQLSRPYLSLHVVDTVEDDEAEIDSDVAKNEIEPEHGATCDHQAVEFMDENTTQDAAYALFIGEAMSGKRYVKLKGARRNRRIMEFFSKPVAQVNSF